MTISGRYGEVEQSWCEAGLPVQIVQDGELLADIQPFPNPDEVELVEPNCPRKVPFDSTLRLGCLSCTHSTVGYQGITEC